MKKYLFLPLVFALLISSCNESEVSLEKTNQVTNLNERELLFSSVTHEEYKKASPFEKRLINKIDAAVNSLNILSRDNTDRQYEAIITLSKDADNKFSNSMVIVPLDTSPDAIINAKNAGVDDPDGKCLVCGLSSGWSCFREVEKYMEEMQKDEIDVHVRRRSDGCFDITYQ